MRRSTVLVSSILAAASTAAMAQDVGRVLSSTAIISQVSVPRQVCTQEVVQVQNTAPATKTGAGVLMGGIAGGAMGNAVGNGSGRAAATILGVLGGAILGDRIEGGSPTPQVTTSQQTVNRCSTQNFLENRTTGYQVVYEYAGKQYSVQMPQDPGPTIQLQIAPVQATMPAPAPQTAPRAVSQAEPAPAVLAQAPVLQEPAPVYSNTVITTGTEYQPFYTAPAVVYAAPVVIASAPRYYHRPTVGATFVFRGGHGHGNGWGHHNYGPYGLR